MTRRTFQTITQRWKITDISGAGTGKLRLHQLRNSPTAIKNAIKVIWRCSCVSKRFPIARRLSVASYADKKRVCSRTARVTSYAILNKMVIYFFSFPLPRARFDTAAVDIPLVENLSWYRSSARPDSKINSPSLESIAWEFFFNDRENRPFCNTDIPPSNCTRNSFHFGLEGMHVVAQQ